MRKSNITTTMDNNCSKTQVQIFNILNQYSTHNSLSLSQLSVLCNYEFEVIIQNLNYLRKQKYVRIVPNYALTHNLTGDSPIDTDTPIEITVEGKIALDVYREERRNFKFVETRAWITLAIALAALVVSIVALFL